MMDKPRQKDSLFTRCKWAKDKVRNTYVTGCYCTEYGIIIAQRKDRCKGFEWAKVPEQENHP